MTIPRSEPLTNAPVLGARMPNNLETALRTIAKHDDRTISDIIRTAAETYVHLRTSPNNGHPRPTTRTPNDL